MTVSFIIRVVRAAKTIKDPYVRFLRSSSGGHMGGRRQLVGVTGWTPVGTTGGWTDVASWRVGSTEQCVWVYRRAVEQGVSSGIRNCEDSPTHRTELVKGKT